MTQAPPLNDLVNVAQQLDDLDSQTLSTGIKTPGHAKGASIRSTQTLREGQRQVNSKKTNTNEAPSQLRTQALLTKILTQIESKICDTLTRILDTNDVAEAKLTLAFLVSQRSILIQGVNAPPRDVTLRELLLENANLVSSRLELLQTKSPQRLLPIVEFLRQRYSELVLYGISRKDIKQELKKIRSKLETSQDAAGEAVTIRQLTSIHSTLEKLTHQASPSITQSLISAILSQ